MLPTLVGALLAVWMLTLGAQWVLRGYSNWTTRFIVANALSLFCATVIGGFGFADGPQPVFEEAFSLYVLPQLVVLIGGLLLHHQTRAKVSPSLAAGTERVEPNFTNTSIDGEWRDFLQNQPAEPARSPAAPDGTAAAAKRPNWLVRHWRGELSLPASYWLVGILAGVVLASIPDLINLLFGTQRDYDPQLLFFLLLSVWLIVSLISVWQWVGIWRSARRYRSQRRQAGKYGFWGWVAQVMVVVGVFGLIGQFGIVGVPQIRETYDMAMLGDRSVADYYLRVMRNGTEIELAGGFKYGLDSDLQKVLKASPNIKVIHLNSSGGRIGEAIKVERTIKRLQLVTYVSDACASACTVAFSAGRERWLSKSAKLGYHSGAFPGLTADEIRVVNMDQQAILIRNGVEASFVKKALATPASDLLVPQTDELLAAHVITGRASPDQFASSGFGADFSLASARSQIRETFPVVVVIEEKNPRVASEIYANFYDDYISGRTNTELLSRLRDAVTTEVSESLPYADDRSLGQMARLVVDEYRFLAKANPEICYAYASGEKGSVDITPYLTEDLLKRENDLQIAIIKSRSPTAGSATDTAELWKKVFAQVRKGPNGAKLRLLLLDTPSPQQYADYCVVAADMFDAIMQQPQQAAATLLRDAFRPKQSAVSSQ